ncbi:MAG: hypothetical protein R3C05_19180 [Pirellulaceae bacterium]
MSESSDSTKADGGNESSKAGGATAGAEAKNAIAGAASLGYQTFTHNVIAHVGRSRRA